MGCGERQADVSYRTLFGRHNKLCLADAMVDTEAYRDLELVPTTKPRKTNI